MEKSKIGIHGVPRSGTSWLGAIIDSSPNTSYRNQPLFSYAFKSYLSQNSGEAEIDNFFDLIYKSDDEYLLQIQEKKEGRVPRFYKESIKHIVYKETRYHYILRNLLEGNKEVKIVGIIRNPKSVLSSWFKAPKEFDENNWDKYKEWKEAHSKNKGGDEEYFGYNKWKEIANLFLELEKQYPERFYLIEYSELLKNTYQEVRKLFKFCNINFTKQTYRFIKESKSRDMSSEHYSVFRLNQVDDKWKQHLPLEITQKIDKDLLGTILEKYLNE